MKNLQKTPWLVVAAFVLPSFIGFFVFVVIPIVSSVFISLTNFSGGRSFRFVGIQNYINAFKTTMFWSSLRVTFTFTIWTVLLQLLLGLGFALLLKESCVGRGFFRSAMFLPNVLSSIAVGLVFVLLLNPTQGPVNQWLRSVGLPAPPWLSSEKTALLTIIIVTTWQNFGYYMVLFLGGLQTISSNLYEAAAIDGAGPVRRFFSVTLPGLSPIVFFSVTMAVIRAFQVFDQVFIMTGGQAGGGPAGSTSVLVFDVYKNGFSLFRFGYAAAESIILLLFVLLVTVVQNKAQERWVTYDVI
jgi:ABC-type sugar transport system permease subunit